jgi:hypothetical protein
MRAPLINSAKENPGAARTATGAKQSIANVFYIKFINSRQA